MFLETKAIGETQDNFLSPAQLQLSDDEFNALVDLLGRMERGEIHHVPLREIRYRANPTLPREPVFSGLFNMHVIKDDTDCGTAACMMGNIQLLNPGKRLFENLDTFWGRNNVFRLFHEFPVDPSVEATAVVLRNFLKTGEVVWA